MVANSDEAAAANPRDEISAVLVGARKSEPTNESIFAPATSRNEHYAVPGLKRPG